MSHFVLQTGVTSAITGLAVFFATHTFLPLWDLLLRKQTGNAVDRFAALRMNQLLLMNILRIWFLVTIVAVVGCCWLDCLPFAVLVLALGWQLPRQTLEWLVSRRVLLLEEQLAGAATGVSNSLRAGMSIHESIRDVSSHTPEPLRTELLDVALRCDHGLPLADCLRDVRRRLGIQSVSMFCIVLEVAMDHSGKINTVMNRLTQSLQEWFRLRRRISAETSTARLSILVMAFCPFLFPLGFYFMGMSDVTFFFTTLGGQVVFSIVIALTWIGVVWARRIVNIKVA